ncbi:MAG: phosphotransferase, partial [Caldilineaceae bacterium]|nr:phosphotransferase [Caldilineaceae bacterium]
AAILQMVPQATKLVDLQSYRPGYLPYPARVTLQTKTGETVVCVLKASTDQERIVYEAQMLQALADLDLAVPAVLAEPVTVPTEQAPVTLLLVSELPGEPLPWIALNDLDAAYRTCQLVTEGVDRLHALTPDVLAHPISALIPKRTLAAEWEAIRAGGGAWFDVPQFVEAFALVGRLLPQLDTPLVFSNGDYNPLNFLVADGALSGWIDFEHACFEDPTIGFAKFLLWAADAYGWGAGAKAGLVERYLYEHQVAPADFLSRLVLRGLRHVQGTAPENPPAYMLHVIADGVQRLKLLLD